MGTVYLVGTGPGDPGLIPLRGAELLGRAGVVVAEEPLPGKLAALVAAGAEVRVLGGGVSAETEGSAAPPGGGRPASRGVSAETEGSAVPPERRPASRGVSAETEGSAVPSERRPASRGVSAETEGSAVPSERRPASAGVSAETWAPPAVAAHAVVVRLLPGDPLRTALGVAEARALAALRIPFEVVPALDDASAAATYAGIAVGGGEGGSGVVVQDGSPERAAEAWAGTVARGGTLALRLRAAEVQPLIDALLRAGLDPETPAACIARPTAPRQRTLTGPLLDLASLAEREGMGAESPVVVVGPGVRTRSALAWLERRPLLGLRVVVTRPRDQAPDLSRRLEERGAIILECPLIRIARGADPESLRRAALEAHTYDWVVFTSANGVERFWAELIAAGRDARALGDARIACIGPVTAAALGTHGLRADVVPDEYVAESLLSAMADDRTVEGLRILLPRAAVARELLPEELRERGATVDVVEAYRSLPDEEGAGRLRLALEAGEADVVTFTASSTVDAFVEAVGADLRGAAAACIGPITAETARGHGLEVAVVAGEHTVEGLVEALVGWAGGRGAS